LLKIILLIFSIITVTFSYSIDGIWQNSSKVGKGELKALEIKGNLVRPYIKTKHGEKALSYKRTIGNYNMRAGMWRVKNRCILLTVSPFDDDKLIVNIETEYKFNSINKVKVYIFKKENFKNKFPFRGEWFNIDSYPGMIDRLRIKRKHGKVYVRAWEHCRRHKKCKIKNIKAQYIRHKLFLTIYKNGHRADAIIRGIKYNKYKNIYNRLRVDIRDKHGVQTIYFDRR